MNIRNFAAALAVAAAFAVPALAHEYQAGDLHIGHPWARATAEGMPTGAAFLTIRNDGETADRLLGASTDRAETVEMHRGVMEDGIARMRPVEAVDLPAGEEIAFAPGGYHFMLIGLDGALVEGTRFPLTLEFEKAGEVVVEIAVDAPGAGATAEEQHVH